MAKLSICVPSRNRQRWFQQTIDALLASPRRDVEFIFADNSDDPQVMAQFMARHAGDRRVFFIPPAAAPLSMLDNWERTVAAASGDWVTVIGDDDYVDPDLAALLHRIELLEPDCEAVDWLKPSYFWPDPKVIRSNIKIAPNSDTLLIPKARIQRRLFLWDESTCVPSVGYSIYHSAISRSLLERIRQRFGGRYFEHPTVDYDSAFKVALEGRCFAYTSRPFSIHGRSPASSSGTMMTGPKAMARKNREFVKELGHDLARETDPSVPIDHRHGVTGSIIQTMLWIARTYGIRVEGWQVNFAKACGENCNMYTDREQFDRMEAGYREALSRWEGGRYLSHFRPQYHSTYPGLPFSGIRNDTVYILDDDQVFYTPAAFYSIVSAMFEDPSDMPLWQGSIVASPLLAAAHAAMLRPPSAMGIGA